MPDVKYAKFDVPENCRLRDYHNQFVDILKNAQNNEDSIKFRDQLFNDSFMFIRSELKTDYYPLIVVDFVPTQAEYERLEKQSNSIAYQKEKPAIQTRGFSITSSVGNRIYINFEAHTKILLTHKNIYAFIFNLVSTLVHEILHCFFSSSKNEQEIHDLQNRMLESFLGVTLPNEIKKTKASDYYTTR